MRTALVLCGLLAVGGLVGWLVWPAAPPPPPSLPAPAAAPPPIPPPVEAPKPEPAPAPPSAPAPAVAPRPPENVEAFAHAMADLQAALADDRWEVALAAVKRAGQARPDDPGVATARRRLADAAAAALRRYDRAAAAPPPGGERTPDDPAFDAFDALAAFVEGLPGRDPSFAPLVPADLPALRRDMVFLRARAEAEARTRTGDWAAAEAAYARAEPLAEAPDEALAKGRRFAALCAKGRALREAGRLDEAAAAYREALGPGARHVIAEKELLDLAAWQDEGRRRERQRFAAAAADAVAAAARAVEDGRWTEANRLLGPVRSTPDKPLDPVLLDRAARLLRAARVGIGTPAGMAFIPAGPFLMGRDDGEPRERPARRVDVGDFYLDLRETTNREYRAFLEWIRASKDHRHGPPDEEEGKDHTPAFWDDPAWNADDAPVVGVDAFDAAAYATWAGKRLPTEAEWEKAAGWEILRQAKRAYPWGDTFDRSRIHADASRATKAGAHPAGRSPCGCFDMAGSAFEWTADAARPYPGGPPLDEAFAGDAWRIIRGGIYGPDAPETWARTTYRQFAFPDRRDTTIGIRLAKTPAP